MQSFTKLKTIDRGHSNIGNKHIDAASVLDCKIQSVLPVHGFEHTEVGCC